MQLLTTIPAVATDGWAALREAAIREVPTAILAAIAAVLALAVGNRVAHYWSVRQKRRESELAALNDFYRLYGQFFVVWKLWNSSLEEAWRNDNPTLQVAAVLERALAVEAGVEALFVKIASERVLTDDDIDHLGLLRQAFQILREHIAALRRIEWDYSGQQEYVALKSEAAWLSNLLLSSRRYAEPAPALAAQQLLGITSNRHEARWKALRAEETAKA